METYLDGTGYNTYGTMGQGIILMVPVGWGDTKLSMLVSQLDTEKKI